VLREHAAHDIFVDVDAESMRDLLGDAYTAELGVAALQLNDRRNEFRGGTVVRKYSIRRGRVGGKLELRCGMMGTWSRSSRSLWSAIIQSGRFG
jgi:hypothetical protein